MSDSRKYAILLGLLFALFVAVDYYTPKPINWSETYTNKDKIPFGTFVLYDLLPGIFPSQAVSAVRLPIKNQLEMGYGVTGNCIFINKNFDPDTLDLEALTAFVRRGNNVFIAAENFNSSSENWFGFSTRISQHNGDSISFRFTTSGLKHQPFGNFYTPHADFYFKPKHDSVNLITLGLNSQKEPVFVKKVFGKGAFFLSSTPQVFCNYYSILPRQNRFAATALSHLPVQPVLWDEYQKQGREGNQSVFRVLMSHDSLKWAYYLALSGIVLFVIFEGKRTQRVIPVWEKPRNTTLDFVQVVGNLYYNYRNHKLIAEKKITYFFEYLRLHYFEHSLHPDPEFAERIAAKSGMEITNTTKLISLIEQIRNSEKIREEELTQLNNLLEEFYRQAGK